MSLDDDDDGDGREIRRRDAGAGTTERTSANGARSRAMPELTDPASDYQNQGLQAYVQIDREAAARLGVSVSAIDLALYNAFGQRLISTIFTCGELTFSTKRSGLK